MLVLLALYVVWCVLLYTLQGWMLFPRHLANRDMLAAPPADAEPLRIDIPGGGTVESWFFPWRDVRPPDGPRPAERRGVVMFFHGNGELIDHNVMLADFYRRLGWHTLLFEFRGYGRSAGTPSEAALAADAARVYDLLAARPDVDPRRIVFHGRSIGGGVAFSLARLRRPSAVIAESTFSSVASFAWRYGVPPLLVTSPFRSDEVIGTLQVPILLMHGRDDRVVPIAQARRLAAANPGARLVEMGGDHNSFPSDPSLYAREIEALLNRVPWPDGGREPGSVAPR
ncbi:MAG: alpha/beta hydrolase [Phycisphaerales bacterium]|nr:alpha/beta hydrolase [Phycisphaerales bacterium]